MKKKVIIIIIVIIILAILLIAGFFILKSTSFGGLDFSAGTKVIDSISGAANKNVFKDVKLNPFSNTTG